MDILGIDLGTHTGFAYNRGATVSAGTWDLATDKEVRAWGKQRLNRRNDPRIKRLCDRVAGLGTFDAIIFEDVQFTSTTYQAHLWAGLRSSIWLCGLCKHMDCVAVGTLKLFATGNGAADKDRMAHYLAAKAPVFGSYTLDDNAVDAAWLWVWGQTNLAKVAKPGNI